MPTHPSIIRDIQKEQRKKLYDHMRRMLSQFTTKDTQPTEYANAMQVSDSNKNMDEDLTGQGGASIAGDVYTDSNVMTGPGQTTLT